MSTHANLGMHKWTAAAPLAIPHKESVAREVDARWLVAPLRVKGKAGASLAIYSPSSETMHGDLRSEGDGNDRSLPSTVRGAVAPTRGARYRVRSRERNALLVTAHAQRH